MVSADKRFQEKVEGKETRKVRRRLFLEREKGMKKARKAAEVRAEGNSHYPLLRIIRPQGLSSSE